MRKVSKQLFSFFRTTYELRLIEQSQQTSPDFYTVTVSATSKAAAANGNAKPFYLVHDRVEVKITTLISLTDVNVGIADRDQTNPRLVK